MRSPPNPMPPPGGAVPWAQLAAGTQGAGAGEGEAGVVGEVVQVLGMEEDSQDSEDEGPAHQPEPGPEQEVPPHPW